ncbi:hypothetical protein HYALB_00010278 [Hymenoscyphus albidus]|uniref:Glycosyltransferase family 8 protein n=1 Tax=Hymenoscyphus albidus TaxID=595503 RepID=A0A9N9LTD1_9HELO|nr:hypothetical protein HYALB_00010278 [Hymenoscyphus albidus]
MLFEILHRLGTKADLLMMYPADYQLNDRTQEGELLLKAKNMYGVKLTPIQVQSRLGSDDTWAKSYTKLLAFNQTQYDRVLSLDSDTTVLKLMDELFLLPSTPVALPRAFWLDPKEHKLTSLLVLVEPSEAEFKRVEKATEEAGPDDYDMEILNKVYGNSAMIIPHRKYGLLTRTFWEDHAKAYLGNDYEKWDPEKVIKEASLIHFSDWPVPKPWLSNKAKMEQVAPKCDGKQSQDCKAREIWFGLYEDFAKRRKVGSSSFSTDLQC